MQNFGGKIRRIMGNVEVAYTKKGDFLLSIRHFHISHNTPSLPPPPPNFSMTLALYFPWVLQSFQEKLKSAYAKHGLLWKTWTWGILPVRFFTFLLFKKRENLTRIYKIFITLTIIKTRWKKRHVDNRGSYENERLANKLKWDNKRGLLAASNFTKMANWRK